MKQLKISVIVPVYNTRSFLRRCINSLIYQNYKNVEIIIVDDGSTDDSLAIANEYATSDKRIKVIHQANKGQGMARNAGLAEATGDYVAFVDSDDFVHPEIYVRLLALALEYNADVAGCGRTRFYNDKFTFETAPANKKQHDVCLYSGEEATFHLLAVTSDIKPAAWDKLYKIELFKEIRFPDLIFEDAAIMYRLLLAAKKMVTTKEALYAYYVHEGSIITKPWDRNKLMSFFKVTKNIEEGLALSGKEDLVYASYIWRINFGIEAWCRCKKSIELTDAEKRNILTYISNTATLQNLKRMPVNFKRKLVYFLFPFLHEALIKLLKIHFD